MIVARSKPTISDQQLVGNDLPEGWASTSLRSLVTWRKGKKPDTLREASWPGAVPYIDIQAFEKGNIRRYADPSSSVLVDADDIVVVWDGARCGHVGKSPTIGALGSTLGTIKPDFVESDYILRFLQSCYDTINSNPRGTGIPHVEPELFWNLKLPLAPLDEQNRLVAKVDELLAQVNAARERLAKVPQILKRFRQSVLAAACCGKLTADWRRRNPYVEPADVLLERIGGHRKKLYERECVTARIEGRPKPRKPINLEPKIRYAGNGIRIPDTWFWTSFKDVASVKKYSMSSGPFGSALGRKDYQDKGIPVVRGQNIQNGKFVSKNFVYISAGTVRNLERSTAYPGDIVVVAVGSSGQAAIIPDSLTLSVLSQNCNKITVDRNLAVPEFVNMFLQIEIARAQLRERTTDTARPFLSLSNLKKLLLPVAPLVEQEEIVHRVEALFKVADIIEKRVVAATARSEKLTQAILAKAFRGELVPTEAELARREGRFYEPASALLAKIEAQRKAAKPQRKRGRSKQRGSK